MPGPIPKRSELRRRTNVVEGLQRVPGAKVVRVPAAVKGWHPIALAWYRSLAKSGQSAFYEPSDWQTARLLADQMSRLLLSDEPNAALLRAILDASRDLMTTEGQRRRLRLELVRDQEQGDPLAVAAAADVDNILAFARA
jgi:hypothetical protein